MEKEKENHQEQTSDDGARGCPTRVRKNLSAQFERSYSSPVETMSLPSNIESELGQDLHTSAGAAAARDNPELDIHQVTVCEDLNINRWLMRMMRLGLSSPPHPSPSRLSLTPPVQSRRTSDCFLGATLGANLKLSPSRGRRFSDSSSLHKGLRFRKSSKLSCFSYCERKNIVQFLTLFSTKVSVTGKVKFIFNR